MQKQVMQEQVMQEQTKFQRLYLNAKTKLFSDESICEENKDWIRKVLEYQEVKGKRSNGLPRLDESCYKTLLSYIQKTRNVVKWFNNKPLKDINEEEFRKVYEDLEEGRIKRKNGKIYEDRVSYYNKIFKSKPFEIIEKDVMARKVIEYNIKKDKNVRFIQNYEEELKNIVQNAISPSHKILIQILGDYGENIFSILQLTKGDFERGIDKDTKEPYYLLNLHKTILKRTRTPRREYNIFPETILMLDKYLENLKSSDKLFNFGLRQAEIMFERAVEKAGVKLQNGEKPTLKDLRSSLACFLLSNREWTTDEIKGRLGHKPSSKVLDVYVSYLALNKNKIRKRDYQGNLKDVREELELYKDKAKRDSERIEALEKDLKNILVFLKKFNE